MVSSGCRIFKKGRLYSHIAKSAESADLLNMLRQLKGNRSAKNLLHKNVGIGKYNNMSKY